MAVPFDFNLKTKLFSSVFIPGKKRRAYRTWEIQKLVEVGFERTPLARLELESSALDRSAIRPLNRAETRDWTRDLQIFSLTLSQLSYFGFHVIVTGQSWMNRSRVEPGNWPRENQGTGTQRRGTKPRTRTQRPWEGHSLIKKPRRYSYELYWENSYKKGKRECTLYCYIYSNISFHHMISYPSIDPFDH